MAFGFMRSFIFLSFFILPACVGCEDSLRINLEKLSLFKSQSSQKALPLAKELISETGINQAESSVWKINTYLVFIENEIHILEENEIPKKASIKQKEQKAHLGHGSGFFISSTQMITNFHVIHNINENTQIIANKRLANGEVQSRVMKLVKVSALYDLALLETETPVKDYVELKLQNIEANRDSFFLMGYPDKKFINTPINYQESLWSQNTLSFYRDTRLGSLSGASGGPVIDQNGNVVGVNYAGTENSVVAVSSLALKDFLLKNHMDCSKWYKIEDCIHKELEYLEKIADQGDAFAQYKLQFNKYYDNLFKKRIAFQELITEIRNLNEAKIQMVESLNTHIKNPSEDTHEDYKQKNEIYRQQTQAFNLAAEKLNKIRL